MLGLLHRLSTPDIKWGKNTERKKDKKFHKETIDRKENKHKRQLGK